MLSTESPDKIQGGRGTHVKHLTEALKGKCNLHMVCYDPEIKEHWYTHSFPAEICPYFPDDGGVKNLISNTARILRHCLKLHKEKPFDLIVTHDWDSQLVAWEFRDLTGVPWVTTYHLFMHEIRELEQLPYQADTSFVLTSETLGLHSADKVIVVSESMKRYAQDVLDVERPIDVILNGVDLTEFESVPPLEPHDGKVKALYCGRIAYQKGIEPLLEAIEQSADIDWTVMGKLDSRKPEDSVNHPYHKKLKELEAAGKCRWVGHLYGEEKLAEYERCDCVAMPSLAEPFGIVALEAMATGRPLLQTGVDGLAEFCNENNSIRIEPTPHSIISKVKSVNSSTVAEARRTATSSKHSWDSIATETVKIYKEAIRGNIQAIGAGSDRDSVSAG